ncbi:MAG: N-acetylmuramic acid 6-phosphate etherase [Verrucomicrobiales bacterium]|nr:N-acetylmuramic acid 6-phosphate etherase [Verrucomicrobiales bacterium]
MSIIEDTSSKRLLGIEGGGTHSTAALGNLEGKILRSREFGPGNLRLLDDRALERFFKNIAEDFPTPDAIGIGLAGLRSSNDHARVSLCVNKVWPGIPFKCSHDLEVALLSGPQLPPTFGAQILVLSGTGSCCYGKARGGTGVKMGGWGHILGDKGSGYEIGLRALKACVYYYDRDEIWSRLGERVLRALLLNEPEDLIDWAQNASKAEIAALATEVFAAAEERDKIARDILEGAAHTLARDATSLAKKLSAKQPIQFLFGGSVLCRQPKFARKLAALIREKCPESRWLVLTDPTVDGAIQLAAQAISIAGPARILRTESASTGDPPVALSKSPTEQRNPRSMNLDRLPLSKSIQLMLSEDTTVPQALSEHLREIEKVIGLIVASFRKGGHLYYVGAGTSGRLGVLDASECPPTFGISSDQIQGIMAGGQSALWQSIEGAEDDFAAGARAIQLRGARANDVVIGIAASGRTPFVWGALASAGKLKARTVLLCFNPTVTIPKGHTPNVVISVDVGPEVLTGSTRLKAGTATKLLLNIFTTLSMVRLGKVVENLMVDLNASNVKLRDRAKRILVELTGCDATTGQAVLARNGWSVTKALKVLQTKKRRKRPL